MVCVWYICDGACGTCLNMAVVCDGCIGWMYLCASNDASVCERANISMMCYLTGI